jgi:hypothetical protein
MEVEAAIESERRERLATSREKLTAAQPHDPPQQKRPISAPTNQSEARTSLEQSELVVSMVGSI